MSTKVTETQSLNLFQKLALIRKPIEVMQRDTKAYGYNYVNENDILAKISKKMEELHVSLLPGIVPQSTTVTPYTYTKTKSTRDGKVYEETVNEVLVQADTTWRWVNNDDPSDFIVVPWAMVGQQSDASQSFGSGLTYSSRYFLLKYFNVATPNDDPDNWRSKQRESEEQEKKMIAEKIIEQVDAMVRATVASDPDKRDAITELVKGYAREKGKPSGNYNAIKDPITASALLEALQKFCSGEGPEKK